MRETEGYGEVFSYLMRGRGKQASEKELEHGKFPFHKVDRG